MEGMKTSGLDPFLTSAFFFFFQLTGKSGTKSSGLSLFLLLQRSAILEVVASTIPPARPQHPSLFLHSAQVQQHLSKSPNSFLQKASYTTAQAYALSQYFLFVGLDVCPNEILCARWVLVSMDTRGHPIL